MKKQTVRLVAFTTVLAAALYFVGVPMIEQWVSAQTVAPNGGEVFGDYMVHGPFAVQSSPQYPAEGNAFVYNDTQSVFVRFTDLHMFGTTDVQVVLATTAAGSDYIELGAAQAFSGSATYTVPSGLRIEAYPYIMHRHTLSGRVLNYAVVALE